MTQVVSAGHIREAGRQLPCQTFGDSRGSPVPPWSPSPGLIISPVVFLTSALFRQSDFFYFISSLHKFDKKCIHFKLQVDSPSGHCSQLEFHSPPEVQQSTLLAQVQPPSPCLVPAHSFKWSWVSSEPVEQNLQPILCTLHMDVKFSHFILNMKIESALTLSLQKKSFVINFHILTS